MADPIKQMVRKPSCGAWQDFRQRVRVGMAGAVLILVMAGLKSWLG